MTPFERAVMFWPLLTREKIKQAIDKNKHLVSKQDEKLVQRMEKAILDREAKRCARPAKR